MFDKSPMQKLEKVLFGGAHPGTLLKTSGSKTVDPTWLNIQPLKLVSKLKTDQNRKVIEEKYKELGLEI